MDRDQTAANRAHVEAFVADVLRDGKADKLTDYLNASNYLQHNPAIADGLNGLGAALKYFADNGLIMEYDKTHKVLGEGELRPDDERRKVRQGRAHRVLRSFPARGRSDCRTLGRHLTDPAAVGLEEHERKILVMADMKFLVLFLFTGLVLAGCSTTGKPNTGNPYVIEVVTFRYKPSVDSADFWARDAKIQADYTARQPGFISRESGYANDGREVLVVVRWETLADADSSMKKFGSDASVQDFVEMIDGSTMKMKRYQVKH